MNRPHIPPAVSQATSKARQWFERNRRRFGYYLPERTDRTYEQVYDEALSQVETPLHLYALSEAFESNALAETRDRHARPPHRPEHRLDPSAQPTEPT